MSCVPILFEILERELEEVWMVTVSEELIQDQYRRFEPLEESVAAQQSIFSGDDQHVTTLFIVNLSRVSPSVWRFDGVVERWGPGDYVRRSL